MLANAERPLDQAAALKQQLSELVSEQKRYFAQGATRDIAARLDRLRRLKAAVQQHENEILTALYKDLNKSETEAFVTEIGFLYQELTHSMKRLKRWAKPTRVKTTMTHIGAKGWMQPEPYGTVLIIAPWNYPFQLALAPLIGALAAGNTAIIKPSELTPHVSAVIKKVISAAFSAHDVAVVEGGIEISQVLLDQPMDYIFFTGGTAIGKTIMEAAAKRLIPVTLELGGKSPCIVHHDADIALAAKRIIFGKLMNVGQTCVAPDYLLVHQSIKAPLLAALQDAIKQMYGEQPIQLPRYGKIVNERHFNRLLAYLGDGDIVTGGDYDREQLKLAPTILDQVSWSSPVMQEEIFGPILPLLTYDELDETIHAINKQEKPLALYLFTTDQRVQKQITESVSFGGGCINDTMMHIATPYLPFGGVGASGLGSYHGEYSFRTFSHYKSILKQTNRFDLSFRYPSDQDRLSLIRRFMK